uniref:Reverse transcriptase domain-containing protein n=1 Tax=Xenopus tropicalis TaxID=8364 RepID=A0A6I8QMV9_XENTR
MKIANGTLADELNTFYARFESAAKVGSDANAYGIMHTDDSGCRKEESVSTGNTFIISEYDVRRAFKRVNPRKAAGPDGISGRVLRACADQLAPVFTEIFNISLSQSVIPTCFKESIIVPVPKKPLPTSLNDYRPVALTSVVMKCFELLVRDFIISSLPNSLDPLQFAYRSNRSTDDAISHLLHTRLSHLDTRGGNYVKMLFIDYSSAFNTIIPSTLITKLEYLGLSPSLCQWIFDFLTGRPQAVRMGGQVSASLTLNTGAPQGCVLSPLLYSLYTFDCVATTNSTSITKFADDTVVVGLISDNDETAYLEEVGNLVNWCQRNNLLLNVSKTKELIVDFSTKQVRNYQTPIINKSPVERVDSFRYLGVHITQDLSWSCHINTVVRKARQRLYHLRRLRGFRLPSRVLRNFYSCTIESILTGNISTWFGNSNMKDRQALQRVVRLAERIICIKLPDLQSIYNKRCWTKARKIMKDLSHPDNGLFCLLRSGRCFRSLKANTERLKRSFFPQAIRALNHNNITWI